ncbi:MAG: hypothetical protein ACLQGV_02175 [Bryobacteraceae bacterium]
MLLFSGSLLAQRAFEKGGHVIYEGRDGHRTDLGVGFSPVLTQRGEVALIRGRLAGYGENFDCSRKDAKNWIAVRNPATGAERTLFNRALPFGLTDMRFCVFQRMQLSPDEATLYLVSPVYATSGSLAIVRLGTGAVTYVPGVNDVYVIVSGPHRGELLYSQRMHHHVPPRRPEDESPWYPFVHARADGKAIQVIADEWVADRPAEAPKLAAYLRHIGGQIMVNGRAFPE